MVMSDMRVGNIVNTHTAQRAKKAVTPRESYKGLMVTGVASLTPTCHQLDCMKMVLNCN